MSTIEKNGISYVSAREIEDHYNLTRKRTWQELQKANLSYIKLLQTHFYRLEDATAYFNVFVQTNKRYNKINLN